jgi:hypothetical protein
LLTTSLASVKKQTTGHLSKICLKTLDIWDTTCHSKCNFTVIWIFASNFGDVIYQHNERLHQDIYNMKMLPRELESSNACQQLLATSERNSVRSTYIHTYIPWIHECVPKTAACEKNHRYLNIHSFYSIVYEKHFIRQYYRSSLHIKNSSTGRKECSFKYFLNATLNFAFSFWRMFRLHGQQMKILMPA